MLLKSLNHKILKEYFPHSCYQKGYQYYLEKRAKNIELVTDTDTFNYIENTEDTDPKEYLKSKVQGKHTYAVEIMLSRDSFSYDIDGYCSCPVAHNCKHVVATLLTAIDLVPTNEEDLIDNIHDAGDNTVDSTDQDKLVDDWLEELSFGEQKIVVQDNKTPTTLSQTDDIFSVIYVLSGLYAGSNNGLQVTLFISKQLKTGGIGKPKPFNENTIAHQKYLQPIDTEILVKLAVSKKLSETFRSYENPIIQGEMGEKLLADLISTERCYWIDTNNLPLTFSKTLKADLHWKIDEQGFQKLHYTVKNKNLFVFSFEKIWYIDQEQSEIGILETGLDDKISLALFNSPKISPQKARQVRELLEKNKQTAAIAMPTTFAETNILEIAPTPCLYLTQVEIVSPPDYNNHWHNFKALKAVAQLSFDYQGITVLWESTQATINLIENDSLTQIQRNKNTEAQAVNELASYNLYPINIIPDISKKNSSILNYFLIDDVDINPLDFSMYAVPELREKGWRVEFSEDYPYQIVNDEIEDWYSSIDEGTDYDWFGLELGIIIKGEKINLLPLIQQLIEKIKNHKEPILGPGKSALLRLSNGRYIKLPAERVNSIINVLIELFEKGSLNNNTTLRLSKLHASRLLELESAMGASKLRWFGGENLRKLASKLSEFKGIETAIPPKEFIGTLRPYQLEGLSWLQFLREYEFGGILADDMGLGKTVQTLCHLTIEKISGRMKGPSLVVAPTSLMFNWRIETERFSPCLKVLVLHGASRKEHFDCIANYDLILTTYPLIVRDKEILLQHEFYLLILDEAQFIKNSKSLGTQVAHQIKAKHRMCLTGTPMENHLGELWSLFHFMMPGLLGEEKRFNQLFRKPIEKEGNQERRHHLNKRIAPFLLRRTKDKVIKELPEKVEIIQHVELEGGQRDLYETIRLTMQKKVTQEIAKLGLSRSHIIILDALLKLRQVCCDPRLLKMSTLKKKNVKSAKLDLLLTLIPELLEDGRRILLFSQFTEMLGLIEEALDKNNIAYVKLTGQTKDRETPVQAFQSGKVPLFLISLKAGGTGLNLTAADTVIHYDPWWNPAVENQATSRAHRMGQKNTVFVYKFIAKGTVEEKIIDMQKRKQSLMEGVFSDKNTNKVTLTENDLKALFDPLEEDAYA